MTRVVHSLWRIAWLAALALAVTAQIPEARAQHGGGGHGGGGMGGFHGGGGMGGFHGGGSFHGDGHFHGGGPFIRFGFGGFPFWGGGYPYYGGYPYFGGYPYYPPAYPYPYAAPYPAPAPYPAYPAPAAAGPASFAVYFATNSDQLNAAAHDTVAQAAAAATHSTVQLEVAGFADATGAAPYNLDLSRRRAEHVGAALVAAGVAQQRIALAWHGESAASGGAQPHDRRVVITIGAPPASAPFPNAAPPNAMPPQPPPAPPPHLSSL
jgi:outer membrane protein OmpA-like peptidoglycan-associated protein